VRITTKPAARAQAARALSGASMCSSGHRELGGVDGGDDLPHTRRFHHSPALPPSEVVAPLRASPKASARRGELGLGVAVRVRRARAVRSVSPPRGVPKYTRRHIRARYELDAAPASAAMKGVDAGARRGPDRPQVAKTSSPCACQHASLAAVLGGYALVEAAGAPTAASASRCLSQLRRLGVPSAPQAALRTAAFQAERHALASPRTIPHAHGLAGDLGRSVAGSTTCAAHDWCGWRGHLSTVSQALGGGASALPARMRSFPARDRDSSSP